MNARENGAALLEGIRADAISLDELGRMVILDEALLDEIVGATTTPKPPGNGECNGTCGDPNFCPQPGTICPEPGTICIPAGTLCQPLDPPILCGDKGPEQPE